MAQRYQKMGCLNAYTNKRKQVDESKDKIVGAPKGAPRSLGLLFMRMNFARIIIAITMVYGMLVVIILGNTEPSVISVFATLGGASIGGLSFDQFNDQEKNSGKCNDINKGKPNSQNNSSY